MVDFDSFMEAVKVTIGTKDVTINPKLVHKYLDKWADAKMDLFVAFGKKLSLEKEMDIKIDKDILQIKIAELMKKYPKYAAILKSIPVRCFQENIVGGDLGRIEEIFPEIFKKGKNLSKALSELVDDAQFDIDLSVILQNRYIKGVSSISIHPLDFVTLSTSGHGWRTCMEITGRLGGFNKVGGFSLMMDSVTAIASVYASDYTIENKGGSFQWHNKICRQLIFIQEDRNAYHCGHTIGQVDYKSFGWDEMLCGVLGPDKKWECNDDYGYVNKAGHFYYDTSTHRRCYVSKGHIKEENIKIGVENLWCVVCGKEFSDLIQYKGFLAHKTEVKGGDYER